MTTIRIRATEACERQPTLQWDTIWVQRLDASGGFGDWLIAGPQDQPESRGGLRAEAALHTATLIQLFTDARAPDGEVLPDETGHRRGWWGDSVRLEDEPEGWETGSLIWLDVERGILNDATARSVKARAEQALAVLSAQGAVARTVVETEIRREQGFLGLVVRHFDAANGEIYAQRFGVLWAQAARSAPMNFGDQGVFV